MGCTALWCTHHSEVNARVANHFLCENNLHDWANSSETCHLSQHKHVPLVLCRYSWDTPCWWQTNVHTPNYTYLSVQQYPQSPSVLQSHASHHGADKYHITCLAMSKHKFHRTTCFWCRHCGLLSLPYQAVRCLACLGEASVKNFLYMVVYTKSV